MQTPERIAADEFARQYHNWRLGTRYIQGRECCGYCEQRIAWRFCYLSLHEAEFPDCAGPGTVLRIDIPYCPSCEKEPESTGCLHVSGLLNLPRALHPSTS